MFPGPPALPPGCWAPAQPPCLQPHPCRTVHLPHTPRGHVPNELLKAVPAQRLSLSSDLFFKPSSASVSASANYIVVDAGFLQREVGTYGSVGSRLSLLPVPSSGPFSWIRGHPFRWILADSLSACVFVHTRIVWGFQTCQGDHTARFLQLAVSPETSWGGLFVPAQGHLLVLPLLCLTSRSVGKLVIYRPGAGQGRSGCLL